MDKIKKILILILPWKLKRILLIKLFGFEIHPTAKIGFSWIFPEKLIMKRGCKIDHLCVAVHLDEIEMHECATIGRKNWITGFPSGTDSLHFKHQNERKSKLLIGAHSAITKNHHLDCTNTISIGKYSTVAGYYSQFLTHSINILDNRQDSSPIKIGDYCFVGSNVLVLGGAVLPSYSVLGAKSFLNKPFSNQWNLYGGNPAKEIKGIGKDAKYFNRTSGFVY